MHTASRETLRQLQPHLDKFLASRLPDAQAAAEARLADPVELVWNYPQAQDREVVALIAACLAYGRVSSIKRAIKTALLPLGPSPAQALHNYTLDGGLEALSSFVYRMTKGSDLAHLYQGLSTVLRKHGSLQACFVQHGTPKTRDLQQPLSTFVHQLRDASGSQSRGLRYLLPDPDTKGACKRMNLFLRWVVRGPDGIDLGLWDKVSPATLTIPLDTHINQICRGLGLATRKTQDWKLAREITENLRFMAPDDPLKYDFALCHLGIGGQSYEALFEH